MTHMAAPGLGFQSPKLTPVIVTVDPPAAGPRSHWLPAATCSGGAQSGGGEAPPVEALVWMTGGS